ncbi:solute carrier family 22 member 1 [Plutella xylostella]|uniref:solute carrier family 22 member 1 n=1 Tax=Plutella xylostella TaxID=51655 RepID=UPI0020327678|nr:solute carrier family 22 member 1 [Plutella xylostella]
MGFKNNREKAVELDDVLRDFSVTQKYHVICGFLLFMAFASNTFTGSHFVFAAEFVQYKCNNSVEQCNVNAPSNVTFENQFDQQCYARVPLDEAATCFEVNQSKLVPCNDWVYENPDSFVGEFQLGCQEWKRTLVGTMHSFGNMIGLLFIGPLSDSIGRKKAIIMTGVFGGVLGLVRSFATNYWLYVVLEMIEAAVGDICSPAFMLAVEIVSAKDRAKFYMITQLGYRVGNLLLVLMAWLFPYFRTFLRVIYTPLLLFILYIYLLDESPRWLLTKGKRRKAVKILEKAAKTNNIVLDKSLLEKLTCEKENKSAEIDFTSLLKSTFSSKVLLQRFLICIVWWSTSTFVSAGLAINSVLWGGNKYFNYAMIPVVDILASIFMGYVLIRFKRKKPLILSFLSAALFFLLQPFLPSDLTWLSILFFLSGKFMASIFFNITYLVTSELFPTHTRNSMHALCSSLGRIGSILAPQTPLLLSYWVGLPSILFGSASLIAAIVTLFVPDTADDSLPDTVHQAEFVGSNERRKEQEVELI